MPRTSRLPGRRVSDAYASRQGRRRALRRMARRVAGCPGRRSDACILRAVRLLVTGGAGFIGSNYVRWVLANTDDEVTVYDALTYAGNRSTLAGRGGVRSRSGSGSSTPTSATSRPSREAVQGHDAVLHFAAESHVDRSITGPEDFVVTNCVGTNAVMHACRQAGIARVVHVSTDEVYGSVEQGHSVESDSLDPRSPYSASKAGSDLIARSYYSTYGLPVIITRSSNNFGPWQYPEKVIPLFVTNLLDGARCRCTATGSTGGIGSTWRTTAPPSTRCCGTANPGEIYNIGAGNELTQPGPHRAPPRVWPGPARTWSSTCEDRLGHDRRYAVDVVQGPGPGLGAQAVVR